MNRKNYFLSDNLPTSLDEARELGVERYFTGKACPAGHVAQRSTRSSHCYECARTNTAWAKANPELHSERMREWRSRNPDYHMNYNRSHSGELYANNFKYSYKDRLASDYGMEDHKVMIALFVEKTRLIKETGKRHFIAIVDRDRPINRLNVEIRTSSRFKDHPNSK